MVDDLRRVSRATYLLHAAGALPAPTPEFERAEAALNDLLERSGGWDGLDRNGRRLAKRYTAQSKAAEPDLVQLAVDLGLLSPDT